MSKKASFKLNNRDGVLTWICSRCGQHHTERTTGGSYLERARVICSVCGLSKTVNVDFEEVA